MKRSLFTALSCLAAVVAARADSLATAQPAYASPSEKAPILGTAQAGSRLAATTAPSGWQAVELAGPHTVYVAEKDTLKNFDVRPGAAYYAAPKADAPVVGLAGETDVVEFADIAGRYNKFSLKKPIVAYVRVAPVAVAPVAQAPAPRATPAPAAAPLTGSNDTLRNDIPASTPVVAGRGLETGEPRLARTFFGTVASTRNPLRPRRPYDFQLNDPSGNRVAYLDISKLLLTEQIDAFIDRPVTLFGTAEPIGSGKEIVVHVETLKLQ